MKFRYVCLVVLFMGLIFGVGAEYLLGQDPHKGQPKECRNYPKGKKHPNCHCKAKCDKDGKRSEEDPKCSVYCRKSDCHCETPCHES